MNYAIILAAGKGSRMNNQDAKVATPILGKPMINYILDSIQDTNIDTVIPILGHKKELFEKILKTSSKMKIAVQQEQLGTAHAVIQAKNYFTNMDGFTLITCGDMPLLTKDVFKELIKYHVDSDNDITLATTLLSEPNGYGRIIRSDNQILRIVEQLDASETQKNIKEVNTGLYIVQTKILFDLLEKVDNNNAKKEYYLTDIIKIANEQGKNVKAYTMFDSMVFTGVNDLYQLSVVETAIKDRINKKHMLNGVRLINPSSIMIEDNVIIKPGVTIYPNTILQGNCIIQKACSIGPNTLIKDSKIDENTTVCNSQVIDSTIGQNTTVGPYAHIRLNSNIANNVRVGNYVEIKNSTIADGTKIAHLSYVGDTLAGKNVNFGCGVVTANYDGINKHQTKIGNDVFIGSNTTLIAPIQIKDKVFIAAGSTITSNLEEQDFAIARVRQVIKKDYSFKYLKNNTRKV